MTSHNGKSKPVITYSEDLALEGLEEQWQEGDPLALVEAVSICGKEGDPYPEWVCKILSEAMTKLYEAVYSNEITINRKDVAVTRKNIHDEEEIKWRLEHARDHLLVSLGLSNERDNAGKIRKRLLRDAYLAELIAQRCKFIPNAKKPFKDVGQAWDDLAVLLEPDEEQPDKLKKFPSECWDAKPDTIKRAWIKHKDKLADCYANNPSGPFSSLDWFLGYSEPEPHPEPDHS